MKTSKLLIIAIIIALAAQARAGTKEFDVGSLINRVMAGENFAGQELILSGVVLAGGTSSSGLINLGTKKTYLSPAYVNYVSIYDSTVALREGTFARIRVRVEESSRAKINDKNYVIIETVFHQCLSCKK